MAREYQWYRNWSSLMFDWFRKRQQKADFLRAAGESEPARQAEMEIIGTCRELFSSPPRPPSVADRLVVSPVLNQALVQSNDGLLRIIQDQDIFLVRGKVVWGQLVQANQILFRPENRNTCPANVIYSADPFFDGRLSLLSSMAGSLFAQKGSTKADREIQSFVDAVTDEMTRVLQREMPYSFTGGRSVYFATCFIQPGHLPDGYIVGPSFPVIINPEETPAMMLLPSRYWAAALISHWREK
jgi:hypothetical protein